MPARRLLSISGFPSVVVVMLWALGRTPYWKVYPWATGSCPRQYGRRRWSQSDELVERGGTEGRLGNWNREPRHCIPPARRSWAICLFDPRAFTWIGNATDEVLICVAMARTGITTFEQTLERELIVGSTAPGAGEYDFPRLVAPFWVLSFDPFPVIPVATRSILPWSAEKWTGGADGAGRA